MALTVWFSCIAVRMVNSLRLNYPLLTFLILFLSAFSEQSCSPNRFYCGNQVPQVPLLVQNKTLWQCDQDGKSLRISFYCKWGCKIIVDDNSYCLCLENYHLCGHELNDIGWRGYENHSLYKCDGDGRNASLIENCQHKCNVVKVQGGGRCSSRCQDGQNYCGYRLKEIGWDGYENDTLYHCRGGNETRVWSKCPAGTCYSQYCKCNPGQYYCGHELFEQLGWTNFKSRRIELQKCAPNAHQTLTIGILCNKCNNTQTALTISANGDPRPTCECKTGDTICGYTLYAMGWDGYDNDTLYLCEKGQNDSHIRKLMACGDGKCRGNHCECTRDKLYCGHKLYNMGWRKVASANYQALLGRCTNGSYAVLMASCNNCIDTEIGSKCECSAGNYYCGHELLKWGWDGYENNTLYQCNGGYNARYTKTCNSDCIKAKTHSSCGGECVQGAKYCGSKLNNKMGYLGYINDYIYLCEDTLSPLVDTGETNVLCSQGCTPGRSYCGYEVQYIWDIENDDLQLRYICNEDKFLRSTAQCTNCISNGNGAYCQCIPGWRYCASTLYETGWNGFDKTINLLKNFTNDTIFHCTDEENVEYIETCARNECQETAGGWRAGGTAHCLCSSNRTYCGHELYERYNSIDKHLNPHYIYRCSRTRLSVKEQKKCGNCYRLSGIPTCRQECSIGQYYCGSDLLLLEGWQISDALPNWLYRCDNSTTAQPIEECLAGCKSNSSESGQDAFCAPYSTPWYWFFGGVAVPLVVIGLGFLLVRIILKHRRLKKFLEEQRIDVSQLAIIKILGEGEFGEVWQGTYRNSEGNVHNVALKLSKEKMDDASKLACANCFLQEVVALDIVSHKNIIKVFGICLNFKDQFGNTVPALVLEYMNGGSAICYMRSERNRLNGQDLVHIFMDICQAGDHLCKLGIIHRDIGARNVLVQKDPHTGHVEVAKLTDFGLAKDIGKLTSMYKTTNLDRNIFHFRYTAPEGFHGCFCSKSDVWSFGVFMWELYTVMEEQDALADLRLEQGRSGPMPYSELDTVAYVLAEACSDRKLKQPRMAPEKMYKIMRQCWMTDEEERPSFEELIKFFNTNCDGSEIQPKITAVDVSHRNLDTKAGYSETSIQVEHNAIPHGYVCGSS